MLVGITGGIGSGKSYVSGFLRAKGYEVYDSDEMAKELITHNADLKRGITALLGQEAYKDGIYQRAYVAAKVFCDADLLGKLNALVHPAVKRDLRAWSAGKKVCFVESAILFSSGLAAMCDKIAVVVADMDTRLVRTQQRDGVSCEDVLARIRQQQPQSELCSCADWIIENGVTRVSTRGISVEDFVNRLF